MGYRYDIKHKWETDSWVVIDTKNHDLETPHCFDTREAALLKATHLDKGWK